MSDMDPQAAAEYATGNTESAVDAHVDVEGIGMSGDPEPGPDTQSVTSALWNTEPNTPLEAIDSPWNPENGGIARVYRGIQKMADVDGLPAIADVVIGMAEEYAKRNGVPSPSNNTDGSSSDSDEDSISLSEDMVVGDA